MNEKLANSELIESSSIFLDLSKGLLNKIDLFLSNTDLNDKQQEKLIKLFEEVHGEGFVNGMCA